MLGRMASTDSLIGVIQDLSCADFQGDDGWIDSILDERQPRKRVKPDNDELRKQLEVDFLAPSHAFPLEWLNKLQQ